MGEQELENGHGRRQDHIFKRVEKKTELIHNWSSSRSNHKVNQQFIIIVKVKSKVKFISTQ